MSVAQRKATARFRGARAATRRLPNRRIISIEQRHIDVVVGVNPLAAQEKNSPGFPKAECA